MNNITSKLIVSCAFIATGWVLSGCDSPTQSTAGISQELEASKPVDQVHGINNQIASQKFTQFSVGNSNVKSIFADGDYVWIGTSKGAIKYNINTDEHRVFDNRSGLLSNGVFHISRLGGKIVVGTYGGGLSLLDEKSMQWTNYNIQHGLGDAFIYDVLEMANGDVWIATWSGVNLIRNGKLDDRKSWELFTVANTKGGLPNDWVYGLSEGKNGELWLATEGGLARYKDGQWENWGHDDGLGAPYDVVKADEEFKNDPADYSSHHARQKVEQGLEHVKTAYNPNYIVAMDVDNDGSVWVGTWGGGLAHFAEEKWSYLTVQDGLPSNHVFMLNKDDKGRLWVGTSKGMAEYTDGKFRALTTNDGLFSNNVFSMSFDTQGNMWVGSYGGVAKITQ